MEERGVRHTCGHVVTHSLRADGTIEGYPVGELEGQDCWECRKARFIVEREAQARRQQQDDAEAGLPPLRGTPRQVPWATDIRARILREARAFIADAPRGCNDGSRPVDPDLVDLAFKRLLAEDDCHQWIRKKNANGACEMRTLCDVIRGMRAIEEARASGSPVIHYRGKEAFTYVSVYARQLKNGMWALAGFYGYRDLIWEEYFFHESLDVKLVDLTGPRPRRRRPWPGATKWPRDSD